MQRLTPARVTMLMFLVVGGLIVAYVAKGLFAVEEKKPQARTRNVPMTVADLPVGTIVRDEHLGLGPALEADLKRDVLLSTRAIVGRVVKEPLKAAQPIRSASLYEPGTTPPLKVGKGLSAVTVEVEGTSALVSGLIKPQEFVDVHFTPAALQSDPRMKGGVTMTLFKGVRVLAINGMVMQSRLENQRNTVTLELSSQQSNAVVLAEQRGKLTLTYNPTGKGSGDLALAGKDRVFLEELLGLEPVKAPEPPPAPPKPFISQAYRGGNRMEYRFRADGLADDATTIQIPGTPGRSNDPAGTPPGGVVPERGAPSAANGSAPRG